MSMKEAIFLMMIETLENIEEGFGAAIKKAEASRQRALKKAANMVKKGFSHEDAAKNHDVSVADLKKHLGEDVEQIDEISQEKLRDYHAKAGTDRLKAKKEVEKIFKDKTPTPEKVQKTSDAYKRFIKRGKGMTAAANKMSEEAEQIDEISSDLARSYIRKARADNAERKDKVMAPFKSKDMEKNIAMYKKMKSRDKGIETAGKKVYNIPSEPRVKATS